MRAAKVHERLSKKSMVCTYLHISLFFFSTVRPAPLPPKLKNSRRRGIHYLCKSHFNANCMFLALVREQDMCAAVVVAIGIDII